MDEETYLELQRIAYHFWDDILGDDSKYNPGFHNIVGNSTQQVLPKGVPEKHFKEWFRAMNAMSAYNVLDYDVEMVTDENGNPYGDIFYYMITNFNSERFIDFCFKLGIKLQENAKLHTVKLAIGDDNIPTVIVDDKKRYIYGKRNESDFIRILKIALAYGKRVLTVNDVVDLCKKTDIQNRILGGQELRMAKSQGFVRDFARKNTFPENLLQYFFVILDKKITAHSPLRVDDVELKEILEGSKPLK